MKLEDVKNEKIKDYLSKFEKLNFEDISILVNEPIWFKAIDNNSNAILTIAECFGDLCVYVNERYIGSFTQRECRNNDGTREICWVCS